MSQDQNPWNDGDFFSNLLNTVQSWGGQFAPPDVGGALSSLGDAAAGAWNNTTHAIGDFFAPAQAPQAPEPPPAPPDLSTLGVGYGMGIGPWQGVSAPEKPELPDYTPPADTPQKDDSNPWGGITSGAANFAGAVGREMQRQWDNPLPYSNMAAMRTVADAAQPVLKTIRNIPSQSWDLISRPDTGDQAKQELGASLSKVGRAFNPFDEEYGADVGKHEQAFVGGLSESFVKAQEVLGNPSTYGGNVVFAGEMRAAQVMGKAAWDLLASMGLGAMAIERTVGKARRENAGANDAVAGGNVALDVAGTAAAKLVQEGPFKAYEAAAKAIVDNQEWIAYKASSDLRREATAEQRTEIDKYLDATAYTGERTHLDGVAAIMGGLTAEQATEQYQDIAREMLGQTLTDPMSLTHHVLGGMGWTERSRRQAEVDTKLHTPVAYDERLAQLKAMGDDNPNRPLVHIVADDAKKLLVRDARDTIEQVVSATPGQTLEQTGDVLMKLAAGKLAEERPGLAGVLNSQYGQDARALLTAALSRTERTIGDEALAAMPERNRAFVERLREAGKEDAEIYAKLDKGAKAIVDRTSPLGEPDPQVLSKIIKNAKSPQAAVEAVSAHLARAADSLIYSAPMTPARRVLSKVKNVAYFGYILSNPSQIPLDLLSATQGMLADGLFTAKSLDKVTAYNRAYGLPEKTSTGLRGAMGMGAINEKPMTALQMAKAAVKEHKWTVFGDIMQRKDVNLRERALSEGIRQSIAQSSLRFVDQLMGAIPELKRLPAEEVRAMRSGLMNDLTAENVQRVMQGVVERHPEIWGTQGPATPPTAGPTKPTRPPLPEMPTGPTGPARPAPAPTRPVAAAAAPVPPTKPAVPPVSALDNVRADARTLNPVERAGATAAHEVLQTPEGRDIVHAVDAAVNGPEAERPAKIEAIKAQIETEHEVRAQVAEAERKRQFDAQVNDPRPPVEAPEAEGAPVALADETAADAQRFNDHVNRGDALISNALGGTVAANGTPAVEAINSYTNASAFVRKVLNGNDGLWNTYYYDPVDKAYARAKSMPSGAAREKAWADARTLREERNNKVTAASLVLQDEVYAAHNNGSRIDGPVHRYGAEFGLALADETTLNEYGQKIQKFLKDNGWQYTPDTTRPNYADAPMPPVSRTEAVYEPMKQEAPAEAPRTEPAPVAEKPVEAAPAETAQPTAAPVEAKPAPEAKPITLDMVDPQGLKDEGWTRGINGLLDAVNADRRAAGTWEAKSPAEVTLAEANRAKDARIGPKPPDGAVLRKVDFERQVREAGAAAGLKDGVIKAQLALFDAAAKTIAQISGKSLDEVYGRYVSGVVSKRSLIDAAGEASRTGGETLHQGANLAPTFYLQSERAVTGMKQDRFTARELKGVLDKNGVKAEERKWLGLDDLMARKGDSGRITKQEVLDVMRANDVRVETKSLVEGAGAKWGQRYHDGELVMPGGKNYQEHLLTLQNTPGEVTRLADMKARLAELDKEDARLRIVRNEARDWYTRLEQARRTPEVEAQLADAKAKYVKARNEFDAWLNSSGYIELHEAVNKAESNPVKFQSGHFNERDILAHVRTTDRVTPDGKRILFFEEVQSDWGQTGRREGFKLNDAEYSKLLNEAGKASSEYAAFFDDPRLGEAKAALREANGQAEYKAAQKNLDAVEQSIGMTAAREKKNALEAEVRKQGWGVTSAPFVSDPKGWAELSLKRMTRYAAENGYDGIAWTNGVQQAERNSKMLSGTVDSLKYKDNLLTGTKDGVEVVRQEIGDPKKELSPIVGKTAADALLKTGEVSGEGIVVGAEGFRAFYEKQLPSYMDGIAKKWGAKTGTISMDFGGKADTVPYIPVTAEMRKGALEHGFSLFQMGSDTLAKGAVHWGEDGRALLAFFDGVEAGTVKADASTIAHETGHILRRMFDDVAKETGHPLMVDDARFMEQWATEGGKWNELDDAGKVRAEEKIAEGFEDYISKGPGAYLPDTVKRVFNQFVNWLKDIYHNITRQPDAGALYGNVQDAFDHWFSEYVPVTDGVMPRQVMELLGEQYGDTSTMSMAAANDLYRALIDEYRATADASPEGAAAMALAEHQRKTRATLDAAANKEAQAEDMAAYAGQNIKDMQRHFNLKTSTPNAVEGKAVWLNRATGEWRPAYQDSTRGPAWPEYSKNKPAGKDWVRIEGHEVAGWREQVAEDALQSRDAWDAVQSAITEYQNADAKRIAAQHELATARAMKVNADNGAMPENASLTQDVKPDMAKPARGSGQAQMFTAGEDSPLFSGTAQRPEAPEAFTPQETARQDSMFAGPQFGEKPGTLKFKTPDDLGISDEYRAAMEKHDRASAEYGEAVKKYRARETNDAEYLAARKKYTDATAEFDVAAQKEKDSGYDGSTQPLMPPERAKAIYDAYKGFTSMSDSVRAEFEQAKRVLSIKGGDTLYQSVPSTHTVDDVAAGAPFDAGVHVSRLARDAAETVRALAAEPVDFGNMLPRRSNKPAYARYAIDGGEFWGGPDFAFAGKTPPKQFGAMVHDGAAVQPLREAAIQGGEARETQVAGVINRNGGGKAVVLVGGDGTVATISDDAYRVAAQQVSDYGALKFMLHDTPSGNILVEVLDLTRWADEETGPTIGYIMGRGKAEAARVERVLGLKDGMAHPGEDAILPNYGGVRATMPPETPKAENHDALMDAAMEAHRTAAVQGETAQTVTAMRDTGDAVRRADALKELQQAKMYGEIDDAEYAAKKARIERGEIPPPVRDQGAGMHSVSPVEERAHAQRMTRAVDAMAEDAAARKAGGAGKPPKPPTGARPDGATRSGAKDLQMVLDMAAEERLRAVNHAIKRTEFAIPDGPTTNLDKAMDWIQPFHYWYTRNARNWALRLLEHPEWINAYFRAKKAIEKGNEGDKDDPKGQFKDSIKLSIAGTPAYFDLLKTINPMAMFTDSFETMNKTKDPFITTLNLTNKVGVNPWFMVKWLYALGIREQDPEAFRQLIGYDIPTSRYIKYGSAALREATGGEKSPFKNLIPPGGVYLEGMLFNELGAGDSGENNRIGKKLMEMYAAGAINPETGKPITLDEAKRAAFYQNRRTDEPGGAKKYPQGTLWEAAVQGAAVRKGPAELLKWLGVKALTPWDKTDTQAAYARKDWTDLWAKDYGNEDELKGALNGFYAKYPWWAEMQLTGAGAEDRNAIFASDVLARIPPGGKTALYNEFGVKALLDGYFKAKGTQGKGDYIAGLEEADKQKFLGFIGALDKKYQTPTQGTVDEWAAAQKQINEYFGLKDNAAAMRAYKATHPLVEKYIPDSASDKAWGAYYALDNFGRQVLRNAPELQKLGVSMFFDKNQRAQMSQEQVDRLAGAVAVYAQKLQSNPHYQQYVSVVQQKFGGEAIYQKQEAYGKLKGDSAAQKAYLAVNPDLKAFWDWRTAYESLYPDLAVALNGTSSATGNTYSTNVSGLPSGVTSALAPMQAELRAYFNAVGYRSGGGGGGGGGRISSAGQSLLNTTRKAYYPNSSYSSFLKMIEPFYRTQQNAITGQLKQQSYARTPRYITNYSSR